MRRPLLPTLLLAATVLVAGCATGPNLEEIHQAEADEYHEWFRASLQADGINIDEARALDICDRLRDGQTTQDIVDDLDPALPDLLRRTVDRSRDEFCHLDN